MRFCSTNMPCSSSCGSRIATVEMLIAARIQGRFRFPHARFGIGRLDALPNARPDSPVLKGEVQKDATKRVMLRLVAQPEDDPAHQRAPMPDAKGSALFVQAPLPQEGAVGIPCGAARGAAKVQARVLVKGALHDRRERRNIRRPHRRKSKLHGVSSKSPNSR